MIATTASGSFEGDIASWSYYLFLVEFYNLLEDLASAFGKLPQEKLIEEDHFDTTSKGWAINISEYSPVTEANVGACLDALSDRFLG